MHNQQRIVHLGNYEVEKYKSLLPTRKNMQMTLPKTVEKEP